MSTERIKVVDFEGNWVKLSVDDKVIYEGPRDLYAVLGQLDDALNLDIEWEEGGEVPDLEAVIAEAAPEIEKAMVEFLDDTESQGKNKCDGCDGNCSECADSTFVFDMGSTALDNGDPTDEDYPDDD